MNETIETIKSNAETQKRVLLVGEQLNESCKTQSQRGRNASVQITISEQTVNQWENS